MWPFSKPKPAHSCTKHHVLLFLAGAAAMHTLSHLMFAFTGTLPMYVWGMEWTQGRNMVTIVVSALVTVGLLWWAKRAHQEQ